MIPTKVDLILDLLDSEELNLTMISQTFGSMTTQDSFNKEEIDWRLKFTKRICF